MLEFFQNLVDKEGFMPHGMCILWRQDLLLMHVISDGIIALAYFAIPALMFYFLYKRKDVLFSSIFLLFALFILACGTTHVMSIWTFWYPDYFQQGVSKAFTAVISIITAIALVPILPKILSIPSPKQLMKLNDQLVSEVDERKKVEQNLIDQTQVLEAKANELNELNSELADMNKIFVDRESRMVELKQRINELLESQGMEKEFNINSNNIA